MNHERQNYAAGCSLGDLVEALYDEVSDLPLSDPAKASLITIMLGDILHREGRAISFQARPRPIIHLVAA